VIQGHVLPAGEDIEPSGSGGYGGGRRGHARRDAVPVVPAAVVPGVVQGHILAAGEDVEASAAPGGGGRRRRHACAQPVIGGEQRGRVQKLLSDVAVAVGRHHPGGPDVVVRPENVGAVWRAIHEQRVGFGIVGAVRHIGDVFAGRRRVRAAAEVEGRSIGVGEVSLRGDPLRILQRDPRQACAPAERRERGRSPVLIDQGLLDGTIGGGRRPAHDEHAEDEAARGNEASNR